MLAEIRFGTRPDRYVDDHGHRHNHQVPQHGQLRPKSHCQGCDILYDETVAS